MLARYSRRDALSGSPSHLRSSRSSLQYWLPRTTLGVRSRFGHCNFARIGYEGIQPRLSDWRRIQTTVTSRLLDGSPISFVGKLWNVIDHIMLIIEEASFHLFTLAGNSVSSSTLSTRSSISGRNSFCCVGLISRISNNILVLDGGPSSNLWSIQQIILSFWTWGIEVGSRSRDQDEHNVATGTTHSALTESLSSCRGNFRQGGVQAVCRGYLRVVNGLARLIGLRQFFLAYKWYWR